MPHMPKRRANFYPFVFLNSHVVNTYRLVGYVVAPQTL